MSSLQDFCCVPFHMDSYGRGIFMNGNAVLSEKKAFKLKSFMLYYAEIDKQKEDV